MRTMGCQAEAQFRGGRGDGGGKRRFNEENHEVGRTARERGGRNETSGEIHWKEFFAANGDGFGEARGAGKRGHEVVGTDIGAGGPERKCRKQKDCVAAEEAGKFGGADAIAQRDTWMLVTHEDEFIGRDARGSVAVDEEELVRFEVRNELEIGKVRGKFFELLVVVAEDEFEAADFAEAIEEGGQFLGEFSDGNGLMDDVAENGQVRGFVEGAEVRKTGEEIFFATERHELTAVAMRPGVTEMEIGDAEDALGLEINGAAMIEPDAGGDFEA